MTRLDPDLVVERSLWAIGYDRVAGVDEVGIGSLAGPVVAAAVIIRRECMPIPGVRDSKILTAAQRERLARAIRDHAGEIGVGAASVDEIARLNILRASHLAMRRALVRVAPFDYVVVDGRPVRDVELGPSRAIVDGDATCYAIACASILAKVTRDRLMRQLDRRCPGYGWEHNAGYGTPEHRRALSRLGASPYHRLGFAPVLACQSGSR